MYRHPGRHAGASRASRTGQGTFLDARHSSPWTIAKLGSLHAMLMMPVPDRVLPEGESDSWHTMA